MDSHNGVPIRQAEEIATHSMIHVIYGDREIYTNPNWWQRRRISYYKWRDRVSDAWDVLRGKAWVDYD